MKTLITKIGMLALAVLLGLFTYSCEDDKVVITQKEDIIYDDEEEEDPEEPEEYDSYSDLYDEIADKGQYYMPQMTIKPEAYWNCITLMYEADRNDLNLGNDRRGLQANYRDQSLAGIANSTVNQGGDFKVGVWFNDPKVSQDLTPYYYALNTLGINRVKGADFAGAEMIWWVHGEDNGLKTDIGTLTGRQCIFTDLNNNLESGIYASVAAHVKNLIIMDQRDIKYTTDPGGEANFSEALNARAKTTQDAYNEFFTNCNKNALVITNGQNADIIEYAITHKLFVINIDETGSNLGILEDVLKKLDANAPVYGWPAETKVKEVVTLISQYGHPLIHCDNTFNLSLNSQNYKTHQNPNSLAQVKSPRTIKYEQKKNFVSFFLSDGDNINWMMGGEYEGSTDKDFIKSYLTSTDAADTKMAFGIPASSLSMLVPSQFDRIVSGQLSPECSLVESHGGGYYFIDKYPTDNLSVAADRLAAHMRQHRIKLLSVVAENASSSEAKAAYQAYVNANDQLEGIIVFQYDNNAGENVMWITNKAGYEIPVIPITYTIKESSNNQKTGDPTYIAEQLKADKTQENSYSVVCIDYRSNFDGTFGSGAAKLCSGLLNENFEVVSLQELVWRMRMDKQGDKTKEFLEELKY